MTHLIKGRRRIQKIKAGRRARPCLVWIIMLMFVFVAVVPLITSSCPSLVSSAGHPSSLGSISGLENVERRLV